MRYMQPRCRADRLAAQVNLPPAPPAPVEWVMTEVEFEREVFDALASIEDAKADNPEVGEDDVVHDVVMSLQHNVPPARRKNFRERLGIYL